MQQLQAIPGSATVSYGDFLFPVAVRTYLEMRGVIDSSGRTFKYREYIFTIECVLTEHAFIKGSPNAQAFGEVAKDEPLDKVMVGVRKHLTMKGLTLRIANLGYGDDLIVPADRTSTFGPEPLNLTLHPIGSNRALKLNWVVRFHLPCEDSWPIRGDFAEFTSEISYSITADGLTIRNISGQLEVFVLRQEVNLGLGIGNADTYWPSVLMAFPRMPGFHRTATRRISRDKRTLEYTITDEQIDSPNPYPNGVVRISCREHFSRTSLRGLSKILKVIGDGIDLGFGVFGLDAGVVANIMRAAGVGTVADWAVPVYRTSFHITAEAAVGAPKVAAYNAIVRTLRARNWPLPDEIMPNLPGPLPFVRMVETFDLSEEIYGREVSLTISYLKLGLRFFFDFPPFEFFKPIDTDWRMWHASLNTLLDQNPYGPAQLYDHPIDVIVNFCNVQQPTQRIGVPTLTPQVSMAEPKKTTSPNPIPPEQSWIHFDNSFTAARRTGALPIKLIQQGDALEHLRTHQSTAGPPRHDVDRTWGEIKGRKTVTIQDLGPSDLWLIMKGSAIRAAYDVEIPSVVSIGGKTPPLVYEVIVPGSKVLSTAEGVNLYAAGWVRIYYVEGDSMDTETTRLPPGAI